MKSARRRPPSGRSRTLPVPEPDGRARILAAAIRHFSERGYEGTTTASVAREAGVTQPLVHHHFGSKLGLWKEAMEELFEPVRSFEIPPGGSPADRILSAAEQFVRFVSIRPELTRVISREGAVPSPRLRHLVDRYLRAPFGAIIDAVRDGQEAGLLTPAIRPDLFLFLLLGAGSHLFDVTALARESAGIDTASTRTREEFLVLIREVLWGVLSRTGPRA